MAVKKLRDIIWESDYIYFIKINKPNKHDKSTWTFKINDGRHPMHGLSGRCSDYDMKTVHMRYGDCFFIAYKIDFGDHLPNYFVDTRCALFRTSVDKYISSFIDFNIYSNDISFEKNSPSFKVSKNEMRRLGINNFIDLCYYYRNYTSIGTGITRDKRNLVILDIDLDCYREDYAKCLNDLLMKLAVRNALPDFKVVNHSNGHVQLQWLIQDFTYKTLNKDVVNAVIDDLKKDRHNGEMGHKVYDFLEKSKWNGYYKLFTTALTDIVNKNKFGDKHYTYWKAKNPMSALMGVNNLELQMPYFYNEEIMYLSKEDMMNEFSTKEARKNYYDEAPTLNEIYSRIKDIIQPLMDKLNKEKISKKKDDDEIMIREEKKQRNNNISGKARNSFVFNVTREIVWEMCRKYNLSNYKKISKLPVKDQENLKKKALTMVKKRFKEEDKKYNGVWPDTENRSIFTNEELVNTFNSSYDFAISHFSGSQYTDEQREASIRTRHTKKLFHLLVVDHIIQSSDHKMKRNEILTKSNEILESSGQKTISEGTLKRFIAELKGYTDNEKKNLYRYAVSEYDSRKEKMKQCKDDYAFKVFENRFNAVNINIIDEIRDIT